MRKVLKIASISLLSLFVILLIAISILAWVVFTPEKLTPIVNSQLDKILLCEHKAENIELTFFSTFPKFGVRIDNFLLKNSLPETPSDTVVYVNNLIASVDIKSLWKHNELIVDELILKHAHILAFTDSLGNVNYDIFQPSEKEDTTEFSLPFKQLFLDKINLYDTHIVYHDNTTDMIITLNDMNADVHLTWKDDFINGKLKGDVETLSFYWDKTDYLQDSYLHLNTPFSFDLETFKIELKTADMVLDNIPLTMNAFLHNRSDTEDILIDIEIDTREQPVPSIFRLMELPFGEYLEGMMVDGTTHLNASLKGTMGDSLLPTFTLQADFSDVKFEYESLPYKLKDISGIADIEMDMNDETKWFVDVHDFYGSTGLSSFSGAALVDQLTDDMRFDVKAKTKLNLKDAKPILPDDMSIDISGLADGDINLKFLYSDFEFDRYDKFIVDGKFRIKNLSAGYDTISVRSQSADLAVKIPNNKNIKTSFVELDIFSNKLYANMGSASSVELDDIKLVLSSSNVLDDNLPLNVDGVFSSANANGSMNEIMAYLTKPAGVFTVTMDMKDSTAIPTLDSKFSMQRLKASTDTLELDIKYPDGQFIYKADSNNKDIPYVELAYSSDNLKANLGKTFIYTDNVQVDAGVSYDESQESFLLQWIPKGAIVIEGGKFKNPIYQLIYKYLLLILILLPMSF